MNSSKLTIKPLPASRKIYILGNRPGIRVPMREIQLTPTRRGEQDILEINPPFTDDHRAEFPGENQCQHR